MVGLVAAVLYGLCGAMELQGWQGVDRQSLFVPSRAHMKYAEVLGGRDYTYLCADESHFDHTYRWTRSSGDTTIARPGASPK